MPSLFCIYTAAHAVRAHTQRKCRTSCETLSRRSDVECSHEQARASLGLGTGSHLGQEGRFSTGAGACSTMPSRTQMTRQASLVKTCNGEQGCEAVLASSLQTPRYTHGCVNNALRQQLRRPFSTTDYPDTIGAPAKSGVRKMLCVGFCKLALSIKQHV